MSNFPNTKAAAVQAGAKFYRTGKPCKRGHLVERRATSGMCVECERMHGRSGYASNREKVLARKVIYRAENLEVRRSYDKDRYQSDPERFKAEARARYERGASEINASRRQAAKDNSEKTLSAAKAYREANHERFAGYARTAYLKDPEKFKANNHLRRVRQRQAVPAWFGELDRFVMIEALRLAKARVKATGIDWAVDHMIPLRAENASGLHCAQNLQVIPASLNASKRNRMIFTEPFAWMRSTQ